MKPETDHYPIRRRGQRRRLDPNWDGIRCLEGAEFRADTEIIFYYPDGEDEEFLVRRAGGWGDAHTKGMYPRPMFQVFGLAGSTPIPVTPCPDCDDWARTSHCTEHHDRDGIAGLDMEDERRRARYPARGGVTAYWTPGPVADSLHAAYERILARESVLASRPWDGLPTHAQPEEEPHILEITGDTHQGPASTLRIPVERRDG